MEFNGTEWLALLVFDQSAQLVKRAREQLALVLALLKELGAEDVDASLNTALVVNFNGVEGQAQIVERLLFKALVLGERCDHLRRHDM